MSVMYEAWPFRPLEQRSLEETAQWWEHCYVPSSADRLLPGHPNWCIITGGPGSGKSVALAALAEREKAESFVIPYPPERWPGATGALLRNDPTHLGQMMATASREIRDYFDKNPVQLASLTALQREFVRWLMERVGRKRAYYRWLEGLPEELSEPFQSTPEVDDLYPTTSDPADIQGQIEELVQLVRAFGFQRVVYLVDFSMQKDSQQAEKLADLFGWLDLTYHPGFALVAAVPLDIVREGNVIEQARGRVSVISLDWTAAECRTLAERHIQLAMTDEEDIHSLTTYAVPELLNEMDKTIQEEFDSPSPAGWVSLAETLLFLTHQPANALARPLTLEQADILKQAYFQRHMLLRIDDQHHGVWRGPRFIAVDEQPMHFLRLLHRRAGKPINWDDQDLQFVAGSPANVHSIASRLRATIEPAPKQWVYVLNSRGAGGYWLENAVR